MKDNTVKNTVDYDYQRKDLFLTQKYQLLKIFLKQETNKVRIFSPEASLEKFTYGATTWV